MAAVPSAVALEPPKIKSVTVPLVSPSICHEMMGLSNAYCMREIKFTYVHTYKYIYKGECKVITRMGQDFLWSFSLLRIQDLGPYLISEIRIYKETHTFWVVICYCKFQL